MGIHGDARDTTKILQALLTLAVYARRWFTSGLALTSVSAVIFVAGVAYGVWQAAEVSEHILEEMNVAQDQALAFSESFLTGIACTRAYLITPNESTLANLQAADKQYQREYSDLRQALERWPGLDEQPVQRLVELHEDYQALADEIMASLPAPSANALYLFSARAYPLELDIHTATRDLHQALHTAALQAIESKDRLANNVLTSLLAAFLVLALASAVLTLRLLASALKTLEPFERQLAQAVQVEEGGPIAHLVLSNLPRHSLIFQAYNVLVNNPAANREVPRSHIVEIVSHELRSPLASILGFGVLLTEPTTLSSQADVERYARIIVKQAQRMEHLTASMLTVSKIDEDLLEIMLGPIQLSPLMAELIEEARQQSKREILMEDDLGAVVCWGDALRLREVFVNLIANALKYSAPDTVVRMSLRPSVERRWAEITVEDQGIGIASEDMPILFKRFGRIRSEQTRQIPGNGLGLYIVQHIIQKHGGTILVHSQPGQGTAVTVRLPLG